MSSNTVHHVIWTKARIVRGSRAKAGYISQSYAQVNMGTHWASMTTLLMKVVCVQRDTFKKSNKLLSVALD